MSPKIDPGGLRERLGRLLRATSAPRALQKRSWKALEKGIKNKRELNTKIDKQVSPKWARGGPSFRWVGGRGGGQQRLLESDRNWQESTESISNALLPARGAADLKGSVLPADP